MRVVTATEFKARCLALIDEVQRTRQNLLVTRHGKPVAEITPHSPNETDRTNPLKDSIVYQDDLVTPIDVGWDSSS